jgi:hypothetical protein
MVFGSDSAEYQLSSSALGPIGGKLSYYQELPTGKLLDFWYIYLKPQTKKR